MSHFSLISVIIISLVLLHLASAWHSGRLRCTLDKVHIRLDLKERTKVLLYIKEKRYKSSALPKRKKNCFFTKKRKFVKNNPAPKSVSI